VLDMNPEIRARWCAALRSGEYAQGREKLRASAETGGDAYCCLGVLCELAVADRIIPPAEYDESLGFWLYADDTSDYPPPAVQEWAGLKEPNPAVTVDGGGPEFLAVVNDDLRWDFARIADAIDGGAS
jgi:hypothetical protein